MNKILITLTLVAAGFTTSSNLIAGPHGGHHGGKHHGKYHHGWRDHGGIGFGIGLGVGPSYYDCNPDFDLDCPYRD